MGPEGREELGPSELGTRPSFELWASGLHGHNYSINSSVSSEVSRYRKVHNVRTGLVFRLKENTQFAKFAILAMVIITK